MSQVNIGPSAGGPPPPRPPARWPVYLFGAIALIVVLAIIAVAAVRRGGFQAAPHATPTATILPIGAPAATSTPTGVAGAATSTAISTATVSAGATGTSTVSAGATATGGTATSTATAGPPTNPTSLRVVSGSCTLHRIVWYWSGALRATSYAVVLYNPLSGAEVRSATTSAPRYALAAGPGATVALKVQSRNAAGAAPGYFTPGSVGRVPPVTTNPISMTASATARAVRWNWTGARHATAYDVALYHYVGGAARTDIRARTIPAHWGTDVTPGVTYYLKVRAVGACAPSAFYSPAVAATAGVTPTPAP